MSDIWYDTREELGLAGYIGNPLSFVRDGGQYIAEVFSAFTEEELKALDIWPAVDVTPAYIGGQQRLGAGFTATLNGDVYDIEFPIYDIPFEEQKDNRYNDIDGQCSTIIYSHWSAEAQSNVDKGIYSDEINAQCRNDIAKMLQDNQTNMDTLDGITTQEELDNFEPIWSLDYNA